MGPKVKAIWRRPRTRDVKVNDKRRTKANNDHKIHMHSEHFVNNNDSKSLSDILQDVGGLSTKYRSRLGRNSKNVLKQTSKDCKSLCTNVCKLRVTVKTKAKTKDWSRTNITVTKPTTYTSVLVSAITDCPISVFT